MTADADLLRRARLGDEFAFTRLYERYRSPLYRFAWRMAGSSAAAEDLVHDCFLELLEGKLPFREGSLRAYLFGVVRNLYRKRFVTPVDDSSVDVITPANQLDEALMEERSTLVNHAIASLSPLQRETLILFEFEELSLDEIAQTVAADTGTVKSRLHRARENLRKQLTPERSPHER